MSAGVMGQKDWDEHIPHAPSENPPEIRRLQDYGATFKMPRNGLLCQHKDTRSVAEGLVLFRCNICGAGKNRMGDWCPADNAVSTVNL